MSSFWYPNHGIQKRDAQGNPKCTQFELLCAVREGQEVAKKLQKCQLH
jgi:hypothetical protein